MNHNVRIRITNTEKSLPVTSLAIDEAGNSPEGPGRADNKPLMGNRVTEMSAPIGILPATLSPSLGTPFSGRAVQSDDEAEAGNQSATQKTRYASLGHGNAVMRGNSGSDRFVACYLVGTVTSFMKNRKAVA